jgi:hypothetical protein
MTLIITVGSPKGILQVSDRRFVTLAPDGTMQSVFTDEGNKALVVKSPGGILSATFTGLAQLAGVSTADWIQDRISDAKAAESGFDACVSTIVNAANDEFSRLEARFKKRYPQTFVLAGFVNGATRPRVDVVTNCQSPTFKPVDCAATFSSRPIRAEFPLYIAGYTPAVHVESMSRIRGIARKFKSHESIADVVVNEIRRASKNRKHGKYIGAGCMAVWLEPTGASESIYYPTHSLPVTAAANLIDTYEAAGGGYGHMMMRGIVLQGGATSGTTFGSGSESAPDVKGRARCDLRHGWAYAALAKGAGTGATLAARQEGR